MATESLRGVIDGVALAVLVVMVVRSMTHLKSEAAWFAFAGTVGPLVSYLALSSRGYQATIALDLAYVGIVFVVAVRTRGSVWRLLPERYWRNAEHKVMTSRVQLNVMDALVVIAIYFALEHFVGGGIDL